MIYVVCYVVNYAVKSVDLSDLLFAWNGQSPKNPSFLQAETRLTVGFLITFNSTYCSFFLRELYEVSKRHYYFPTISPPPISLSCASLYSYEIGQHDGSPVYFGFTVTIWPGNTMLYSFVAYRFLYRVECPIPPVKRKRLRSGGDTKSSPMRFVAV